MAQVEKNQNEAGQESGERFELHGLFAGGGDQGEALRELATSLGIGERVHLLGFRRDVAEIMAACDVVALPSSKEGLANLGRELDVV